MELAPEVYAMGRKRFKKFEEQYMTIIDALVHRAEKYYICLIALFGSVLTGTRPGSDIDILILLKDDYKRDGINILDLRDDIRDYAESCRVNDIPLDLHVVSASSFVDTSHGTAFKHSFSANNEIIWEDGVTIDRRFIEIPERL